MGSEMCIRDSVSFSPGEIRPDRARSHRAPSHRLCLSTAPSILGLVGSAPLASGLIPFIGRPAAKPEPPSITGLEAGRNAKAGEDREVAPPVARHAFSPPTAFLAIDCTEGRWESETEKRIGTSSPRNSLDFSHLKSLDVR